MKHQFFISAVLASAFFATDAAGVIIHPADDGSIGTVPRPAASVVGRWSTNASAVAIAPNHILTTRHQGGGVGTTVVFGGMSYTVAAVTNVGTADLRVARITTVGGGSPANLTSFTPVYTGIDSVSPFTLGGFGRGRGADLVTTGGTYGYQWASEGNTNLRFGRNTIETAGVAVDTVFGYTSDVLGADFDGHNAVSAVPFEAMATQFDSGSGWFVENGAGNWQVAAITRAVGHAAGNGSEPGDRALFASHLNAAVPAPDGMDAVRLSSYRTFIESTIPEPGSISLLACVSALLTLRRRRSHLAVER